MNDELVKHLRASGIAIIRTDTLYGIVARAENERAVERIFAVKARDRDKPLIVLLDDANRAFDHAEVVETYSAKSDVPTTVIVESPHAPAWLRHADGSVGYRVPRDEALRALIAQTGPLVAPSANPQGEAPAASIEQAKKYFGDKITLYIDGGEVPNDQTASRIIKLEKNGSFKRLR